MYTKSVFSAILGLSSHWRITGVNLARQLNRLEISVGASHEAQFPCPICRGEAAIVSAEEASWQHDNILNLQAQIKAALPIASCSRCGLNRVLAPWEKSDSKFRPLDGAESVPEEATESK